MDTPLWQALQAHVQATRGSVHTPGHKNGQLLPPALSEAWGEAVFRYDLTEVGDLDVLAAPQGVLRASQAALAASLGWPVGRYLVGGSTLGLLAALFAFCRKQTVLVPRHVHQSVLHGLVLAEAEPVFLPVDWDASGLPVGVCAAALDRALAEHPEATAMLLLCPTYYGTCGESAALVELARAAGLLIIADAAHAAHYPYHEALPALPDADVLVLSSHKTLPVLTGASILLARSERLAAPIDRALRLLSTTSPSYLALASLEVTHAWLAEGGKNLIDGGLAETAAAREQLSGARHLTLLQSVDGPQDPLRWVVASDRADGETLVRLLAAAGWDAEWQDGWRMVLLLPLDGPSPSLIEALLVVDRQLAAHPPLSELPMPLKFAAPQVVCSLSEVFASEAVLCPLSEAEGRICAETLSLCPPGIPLVLPGERICAEVQRQALAGGHDPSQPIWVMEEGHL